VIFSHFSNQNMRDFVLSNDKILTFCTSFNNRTCCVYVRSK